MDFSVLNTLAVVIVIGAILIMIGKSYEERLEQKKRQGVLTAVNNWVARHPNPNKPCIFLGTISLAPEDVHGQIRAETQVGLFLRDIIELARNNGGGIDSIHLNFR